MAAGILTQGITLAYKAAEGSEYTVLTNLMEIPEIGNGEKEMIDVTTLDDTVKRSIAGLGDSAQTLGFKFLFEQEQFKALAALEDSYEWKVAMPVETGIAATFTATPAVRFDGAATNGALTYTLNLSVESAIVFE